MPRVTKESIDRFFDYGLHVETRTLYIGDSDRQDGEDGSIDAEVSRDAIKGLYLLQSLGPDKPIEIILNSFGGDWFHGLAIYDAIKACVCHVNITVFGSAMSMGSVVLQAADHRVLHPNATIMIHDGYESRNQDTPATFQSWAEYSKRSQQKMYQIFAERSGKPASYWKAKCASDFILTATEAIELNLADSIFQPPIAAVPAE